MVQHIVHQSHGDYEWSKHTDNSIGALMGGVALIIFGVFGLFKGAFSMALFFIFIGAIMFYFGKRGRAKAEEHYQRVNNAPITRISYD